MNEAKYVFCIYKLFRGMAEMQEGKFMRKGETGDWKNHLSEEQVRRIQLWEEKYLEGSDLKFVYELN